MNLGVQYYRAPFPEQEHWADDFAGIRDAGLNTVQLWVLWAWVEPKPGEFRFDDYDELVALAEKTGLGVVLSTIAEVQPYWIHRQVPGSEMINHMGQRVVSSNRGECHFGLTPGGCTDHPGVWERMSRFLAEVAGRYRSQGHVRGWDAWNETRWNVNSDGLVCFCEHTLAAFRGWLDRKYGGLDGLNAAWKRRYGSWDDVMPGKLPPRPYTEMMAFEHFLTFRSDQLAIARYRIIKDIVGATPVTVHGPRPCPLLGGVSWQHGFGRHADHALNRGNDWFMADAIDGIGCSSFPTWFGMDDADFAVNVEMVHSAARGKRLWLSELQGGRAVQDDWITSPVDAADQQKWIWNGIAAGADTILFWCWRDEVFGKETTGFGLAGSDPKADERLAAMKVTGQLIRAHAELIAGYRPLPSPVGVLFSPQAYYIRWAQQGTAEMAMDALKGYCRALARTATPFRVIEEEHLDQLTGIKVLFAPRAVVTDPHTEEALAEWVRAGGTLVAETECGSYGSNGIYRYPADRFLARLTGVQEIGRRSLSAETIEAAADGRRLVLGASKWLTPMQADGGEVLAKGDEGPLIVSVPVGAGRVVLCGTFLGEAYYQNRPRRSLHFEQFVRHLVDRAEARPDLKVVSPTPDADSAVLVSVGESAGRKVVTVTFPPGCDAAELHFAEGFFAADSATELITSSPIELLPAGGGRRCLVPASSWGVSVLVENPAS